MFIKTVYDIKITAEPLLALPLFFIVKIVHQGKGVLVPGRDIFSVGIVGV